jgi:hypothetical protein
MGYFSELALARQERGPHARSASLDLCDAAAALGGEVDGTFIRCPSPGSPADDRSCVVRVSAGSVFIYDCAGSEAAAYRMVRDRLDLPAIARRSRSEDIDRVWSETTAGSGTIIAKYLWSRGIRLPVPLALRFHPALYHRESERLCPAMVAERLDVRGQRVAIHRTFLRHDGRGKARVEPQRKDFGRSGGTAIRLSPVASEILIAEGIETALSAMQIYEMPGWATGSAMALRQLILPSDVRAVLICADGDEPGETAALAAGDRWRREGRRVRLARAPRGKDFNDLLLERRP